MEFILKDFNDVALKENVGAGYQWLAQLSKTEMKIKSIQSLPKLNRKILLGCEDRIFGKIISRKTTIRSQLENQTCLIDGINIYSRDFLQSQ
jgi:hypothetical protein